MSAAIDYAVVAGLLIGFSIVYFGFAFLLVKAYDDSRQHITDEIAEWNKRETENKEASRKHKEIEWLS